MHYGVWTDARKRRVDLFSVSQVALDEFRARVHGASMAFAKIIEDCGFMALIEKQFGANAPDITGAANDENFHAPGKCGAIHARSKRSARSNLRDGLSLFLLKGRDHLPDTTMLARSAAPSNCTRTPLQDIDIDVAHTPAFHVETARLVEIDRFGSHERSAVIVNYVFFVCIGDSKPGAEREARPIGRGAHHVAP